jgi:YMGG-like Gly-zipper
MTHPLRFSPLLAVVMVSACTTFPTGPSVMALPGSGKSFDQFRVDDLDCRQYAGVQAGGTTPDQAASDSGVRSAALGTVLGAAAGAAIGGSQGAAAGAGAGLLVGALAGTGSGQASGYNVQRRYDSGYVQCMYAKGHKVPVSGRYSASSPAPAAPAYAAPPPPPNVPPPPPAYAPPPPPPYGSPPPPPYGSPPPPPSR